MVRVPGFTDEEVRVCIPQKKIMKFYHTDRALTPRELAFFARKVRQIEKAIHRLSHVQSSVELIILRHLPDK